MSDDKITMKVVSVSVIDTGIGREAGFENDAALIAHAERERAKMLPEARAVFDRWDAEMQRKFIFGDL